MANSVIYLKKDFKQIIHTSGLDANQKAIMYYFIDIANPKKDWTCFPSHAKIAEVIGRSISTVKRAITGLIRHGFLSKLAQFRRYGGFQSSNLYTLFIPSDNALNDHVTKEGLPEKRNEENEHHGQMKMNFDNEILIADCADAHVNVTDNQNKDKNTLIAARLTAIIKSKKKKRRSFYSIFKKK